MAELDLLVGQGYGDVVRGQLETYLATVYVEVIIDEVAIDIVEQALDEIAVQLEKEIERELPAVADKLGKELETAISDELDRILVEIERGIKKVAKEVEQGVTEFANELGREATRVANGVSSELPNLIQINMTEEDLVAFLNNLLDSSDIGYANNMAKLGYADASQPLSMSIYPKDLAAKQKVV